MKDELPKEIDEKIFPEIRNQVHKRTGITIDLNRKTMVVSRMRSRLLDLKIDDYKTYLNYLKTTPSEEQLFINQFTTNETYFYRTPRVWDFFENVFLPKWKEEGKNQKVHLWSAASSTGEEAHTLGVICEAFKESNPTFSYRIIGTDIDSNVVEKAKKGLYVGRAIQRFRDAKPDLFKNFMEGNDEDGFRVLGKIKSNITFQTHNLFKDFKYPQKFDLVFLRNVLIYFVGTDQEIVLRNIQKCLSQDGHLIIGESESLNQINTNFQSVSPLIYKISTTKEEEAA